MTPTAPRNPHGVESTPLVLQCPPRNGSSQATSSIRLCLPLLQRPIRNPIQLQQPRQQRTQGQGGKATFYDCSAPVSTANEHRCVIVSTWHTIQVRRAATACAAAPCGDPMSFVDVCFTVAVISSCKAYVRGCEPKLRARLSKGPSSQSSLNIDLLMQAKTDRRSLR